MRIPNITLSKNEQDFTTKKCKMCPRDFMISMSEHIQGFALTKQRKIIKKNINEPRHLGFSN